MAESTILTPIELTGAELDAVSGGNPANNNFVKQKLYQDNYQKGFSVYLDSSSGPLTFNGGITASQTLSSSQSQSASLSNSSSTSNSGSITTGVSPT